MLGNPAPSDQRAGVRPISFVLDDGGSIGSPVTLAVRPEDLSRTETARATVNQTLGREVTGWVDHFGEGLPHVAINGHTGWRYASGLGMDGAQSFFQLNDLVVHAFPSAKQAAIDIGSDPASVKLIFVDLLDQFAWSVVPTQFVLRRSKSRPLLFQYNISMQAVATGIDFPAVALPFFGNQSSGLVSLDGAIAQLASMAGSVESAIARAGAFVDGGLAPIAATIKRFVIASNALFGAVNGVIRSAKNFVIGVSNRLIGMAGDIAKVGLNIFRTLNNIRNLPADLKAVLGRLASAYNEVLCIFSNSLRPRKTYEDYTGLYGASNCSSTTGGRQDSAYANKNAFSLIQPARDVATFNSNALNGVSVLSRMDPVLSPLPYSEIGRHMTNIVTGLAL